MRPKPAGPGVPMLLRLILRRVAIGVATLAFVSLLVFLGTQVLPGDAAQIRLGQEATPENVAILRGRLGLDRPLHVQYLSRVGGMLTGDLGRSLADDGPVSAMIAAPRYNTVVVAALTAAVAIPVSITLGLLAAMWPGKTYDRGLTLFNVGLIAAPKFFVATCLVAAFVLTLDTGSAAVMGRSAGKGAFELLQMFIDPVLTLAMITSSQLIRMTGSPLLKVLPAPCSEMAVLKGVPRWGLVPRHVLPNAIGPIVNVVALNLAYRISGVVVVEVYRAIRVLPSSWCRRCRRATLSSCRRSA